MTGVMSFLLAIVLSQYPGTQSFSQSLHGYWGSIIYIIAGALSVAAQNKFQHCLVKSSLAVNVFSAVTAGMATILLSLDLAYGLNGLFMGPDCIFSSYCDLFMSRTNGISGVLLVFSLLQFIVSICMSLYGLDATCCAVPEVRATSQFPSCGACISLNNPCSAHSNEEGVFVISNPSMNSSPLTRPPEYSEIEPQFQP
ncbi:membrane-spanning 4-domains subfamily A member 8-like isoform X2 [Colossoma macropomum]|nr:membrane-spanning 4-domains subfamily A member 8-like isoform X2 [Colossoma macropomum]